MNTVIEQLENNKVKMTVTIAAADVDKAIAATYRDFASRASIPGFRKGKVPRPVIDNAFGGKTAVMAAVTEDVINDSYPLAIDENDLTPVARPEFDEATTSEVVAEGKDYTYAVTVEVEPAYELSSYEPVAITMPSAEVTDDEVDDEVAHMVSHYTDFVNKGLDLPAEDGDRLTLKIAAKTDGGRELENLTSDEFSYTIGSVLMPDSFDAELIGLKVGDAKSFEILVPLAPTHYLADLAGKANKVAFDVEVRSILTKANPELTDEWVMDTFGFADVTEFRTRIREMIVDDREQALPRIKEDRVMAALRERVQGEPSEAMVSDKESELMQNFFQQLQRSNTTYDAYLKNFGLTKEQFRDDIKKQAKDECLESLGLNAWAKHAGLSVTPEEITAEFEKANPEQAAELEAEWRANGQLHVLRQSMLRERAFHQLVDGAQVTEEAPHVHDHAHEAAEAAEAVEAAEEAPKPKKTRKKRAEAAEAPAEAAVEAAPAETSEAAEEAPKPKRTRKKKAEEAPADAAEAPAAE